MDKNKRLLITGGYGFLGRSLIDRLTKMGFNNLVAVARSGTNLMDLKEKYPHVEIITGDIADPFVCEKACKGVAGIFHTAAFKHVRLAEGSSTQISNARECVLSNVQGTLNILEQTRKTKPDFIIGISTDKVAQVSGIYGATKMILEGLFKEYEDLNPDTKYRVVRYGNVLQSSGSVIGTWQRQMKAKEEIMITDPDMTRFYWKIDEAVDHVFNCLREATNADPYVCQMRAIRLGDLLEIMMEKYGKVPVKTIGLQPGENLHEKIVSDGITSNEAERWTKEEIEALV